jgi:hypothetical protein
MANWEPSPNPFGEKSFTRDLAVGTVILYERAADHHWFFAVYRGRERQGGEELGGHTEESAKAACLRALGLKEAKTPHQPAEDDFFAFAPGTCSSCKAEKDILRFKSQCHDCLVAPVAPV